MANNTNDDGNALMVTMVEQLGGKSIFAMAFERAVYSTTGVTFHVAKGLKAKHGIKWVKVELDAATDTYWVQTMSWHKAARDVRVWDSIDGVHADSLRSVVESTTGLRMTLGTMQVRS